MGVVDDMLDDCRLPTIDLEACASSAIMVAASSEVRDFWDATSCLISGLMSKQTRRRSNSWITAGVTLHRCHWWCFLTAHFSPTHQRPNRARWD